VGVPDHDSRAAGSSGFGQGYAVPAAGRAPAGREGNHPAVVESKIQAPSSKRETVARTALVKRLRQADAGIVLVVAPAGYGKTTLLAQWAAADPRPVAWLTCDERDNDPVVLLTHAVAALDRVLPCAPDLVRIVQAARSATWAAQRDRALRTLASCPEPVLFVLDAVDCIQTREGRAVIVSLIDHLPAGSTVALCARVPPRLPLAGLRSRSLVEAIGTSELAFSGREAQLLLAATADLGEDERADVIEACEGWPAALYLAALAVRDGGPASGPPAAVSGTDRYLADYMGSVCLSHLRPSELRFLRRTAVLPELSAPLCDAVLHEAGSKAALARIARANLFLFPVEGRPGWFRVHRLFRDLLQRELMAVEPQLAPALHRRATAWYEKRGDLEPALEHADAAGDVERVIDLIDALALPLSSGGRLATVEAWLGRFDERLFARYPILALHACRVHALRGRSVEAERMLAVAERGARRGGRGASALRPQLLVMRAALARNGPRRMLADARAARARLSRANRWHTAAVELEAHAAVLLGAGDEADALLAETVRAAATFGLRETQLIALSQQSLLARARGDDGRADDLAAAALELARSDQLAEYPTRAIALAAAASSALRHGRWGEARQLLAAADPARPALTAALPWLAVGTRLELARGYLALHDADAARALLDEVDAVLAIRPELGVLCDQARDLRREVDAAAAQAAPAEFGLTPAELRLLPLLATHLSFREIADELHVSRNTVKTQAISIYRRLGVSGRSEAIQRMAAPEKPVAA
jgi:LuxR family maltose regulon positive regulatory protein